MFRRPFLVVLLVLLADQSLKYWVKTHMYLGQEFNVFGSWFNIFFTENAGMAFGMELGGKTGKIILSIFRIIAVFGIMYYLFTLVRNKSAGGLLISVSLILAGALGNIVDSAFYGMLFSKSTFSQMAQFMPPEGGYASFLHGSVVDMFYFPIIKGYLPGWLPLWGGDYFIFFRPVFNIADSAITIGIFSIIIFQKRFFPKTAKGPMHGDTMTVEQDTSKILNLET